MIDSIRNFIIRRKLLLLIILLVSIVIVAVFVFFQSRRKTNIITPSPLMSIPQFQDLVYSFDSVSYQGEGVVPPPQLGIYQNTNPANKQAVSEKIAAYLNFSKSQSLKNTWISPDQKKILLLDEDTGYVTIFTNSPDYSREPLGSSFNLSFTLSQATSYLNGFDLNNLTPVEKDILYLTNDVEPKETTPTSAYLVKIPFVYLLENYPVYYQGQTLSETYFLLDKNSEIVKFITYPFQFQPTLSRESKTISVSEAVENIKRNNFTVVNSTNIFENRTGSLRYNNLTFDLVALEYRFIEKDNTLYPFYHFTGESSTDNQITTLEIITPATLD